MNTLYSPRIDPKLIPILYRTAKERGMAMTKLVNGLITKALADENPTTTVKEAPATFAVPTETSSPTQS